MTANAAWNIWNFRRHLVGALLTDGYRVTVVAPEDEAVSNLVAMGCRFIPLTMDVKGLNPLQDIGLAARLWSIFSTEKPDVILSFTIKNNIFGAFAARILGIPFLPNVTGLGTAFLSNSLLQALVERLYRAAFKVIPTVFFQNKDDRDIFINRHLVHPNQVALLPGSGIDLDYFTPVPLPADKAPVFLMIARILRDKGVLEFVEAASQVRDRNPHARFQLLGAADVANRTAISLETVRSWEQTHGIEYLGTSTDVRIHIAASHCVVLPSYREGAPRTLIEAAAMARPVITTNVPGCRAVVEGGSTGFVCQPRDANSLAAACFDFIALTPAEQQAMGVKGRAKMEQEFCQSIVVQSYRQALSSVAERSYSIRND